MDYRAFLEAKTPPVVASGIEIDPAEVNPNLKDFVREAVVPWALRRGRAAIFSSFGLHKTSTQIELARLLHRHTDAVPLIGLPLGVRHEFMEEAELRFSGDHAVKLRFIRSTAEADEHSINLTNYESLREGKIEASAFGMVSLDEAAVLRGFGGTKTFRELMSQFAGNDRSAGVRTEGVRYRFVATATPDPNDFIELLAYAAFLGVMDVGEAKTRFFKRDSEKADRLTIHPHKVDEFWLWVSSWALFIQRPSDLGYPDDGYVLPETDIRWHEVPTDHAAAGEERDGQVRMFKDYAGGVIELAGERRASLSARVAKLAELRAEDPRAHRVIWHHLEAEREAIERSIPDVGSIYGSQKLEENERLAIDFKHGRLRELATKPSMSGAGSNFQMHCNWAIFLDIDDKFHDLIQAVHRLVRFGQNKKVRIDFIYSEAMREVRRRFEAKWQRHDEQAARMRQIIKRYGLSEEARAAALKRSIGCERAEASGETFRLIHADCVDETSRMADDSVDLIVTSIPFSTQYEYTPSYNDFGHTDDDAHFWAQMDFLTPHLMRVLKPGRVAVVHVKDRIVPGGINGFGFQTVSPFSDQCVAHFMRHGFAYLRRKTVPTDVVRENAGTWRLGWSEQLKDGTRMGSGMPEYGLLFRKPPSDRSDGYADEPVIKDRPLSFIDGAEGEAQPFDRRRRPVPGTGYSRARWQIDAHGVERTSNNRLLLPEELRRLVRSDDKKLIYRGWKAYCEANPYDYEEHVAFAEELDAEGKLPPTFALIPAHSDHPDIWNVTRMRTLNSRQVQKGQQVHLCPLQLDFVDRAIRQYSMPGEIVFDPFAGIGTVPYCAIRMGRYGLGTELNPGYWRDSVEYCREAEAKRLVPTLLDLMGAKTLPGEPDQDELDEEDAA